MSNWAEPRAANRPNTERMKSISGKKASTKWKESPEARSRRSSVEMEWNTLTVRRHGLRPPNFQRESSWVWAGWAAELILGVMKCSGIPVSDAWPARSQALARFLARRTPYTLARSQELR